MYIVWLALWTQRTSSTPAGVSTPVVVLVCDSNSRVSEMCPLPTPLANTNCWSAWASTTRSPAYWPALPGTSALESGSVIASLTRFPVKPSVALALAANVADSLAIPLRPRLTCNRAVAFLVAGLDALTKIAPPRTTTESVPPPVKTPPLWEGGGARAAGGGGAARRRTGARPDRVESRLAVLVCRGDHRSECGIAADAIDLAPQAPLAEDPAAGAVLDQQAVDNMLRRGLTPGAYAVLPADEHMPVEGGDVIRSTGGPVGCAGECAQRKSRWRNRSRGSGGCRGEHRANGNKKCSLEHGAAR